jgi:hypothetical protein
MTIIGPELPDLPGVPGHIGPILCPGCGERTAVVHHVPDGEGGYVARLVCAPCTATWELDSESYTAGLAAGVLHEHQKWHESDGTTCPVEVVHGGAA